MLRRDFIRSGSILIGGVLVLHELPLAEPVDQNRSPSYYSDPCKPWHHGHRRCGCATPPHKQALMEWGIYGSLPD